MNRRTAFATGLLWLALASTREGALLAQAPKLDPARRRELQALLALADVAQAGQKVANDLGLEFHPHFLRGSQGNTYVPYSLAIGEHSARPRSFALYVRLVRAGAGPAAQGRGNWGAARIPPGEMPVGGVAVQHRRSAPYGEASAVLGMLERERQAASPYDFEDVYFVELDQGEPLRPLLLRRALAVPPGDYNVFLAASETSMQPARERTAVLVSALSVPDFSGDELLLSSLIVAARVVPVPAPLGPEQQMRRPYAIGATEVVPAEEPVFTPDDEPAVVFQIYNAGLRPDRRPDISIEYLVMQQRDGAFIPHGKLEPQQIHAKTLPKDLEARGGRQLSVVQSLPMAVPPGIYRLEVKVTDRVTSRSVTAEVDFALEPAR